MEHEPIKEDKLSIRQIQVDLEERSVTFIATDHRAVRFTISTTELQLELLSLDNVTQRSVERLIEDIEEETQNGLITVSGKLKSPPREGKPDRRQLPTATAQLAVHEEGSLRAKLYFATFHGQARQIALGLSVNAAVTVSGYPHPAEREDRLDTLSVIKVLRYPNQPPRRIR